MEFAMKNQLIISFAFFAMLLSINLSAEEQNAEEQVGTNCQGEECPPKQEMQEATDDQENNLGNFRNIVIANEDEDDCSGDNCPEKQKEKSMKESTENRAFADEQECVEGEKDCPKSETDQN
jgi:hypothetical protein